MTPVRPGHRGSLSKASTCATLVAAMLLLVAGCSSKKQQGTTYTPTSGLGEQGVGGKGSLSQFEKGTLGAGEGGPLHDIHFDYNDATVRPQDSEILRDNARWLSGHAQSKVQVEGHCDERGSEEYNIALGARRAQAAKDYLVTLGIAGGRISTISYGKELPLCTEHNEQCWERNRRDHFVVAQ